MKQRSLIKMFLLFIVTLGIYRFYWLYKTRQELASTGQQPPRFMWFLLIQVFFFASIGVFIASMIASGTGENSTNDEMSALGIFSILLFYIVLLVAPLLMGAWYWFYAKAADGATNGKIQFALGIIALLLIPDGFDMLIFQDAYNSAVANKNAVTQNLASQAQSPNAS